MKTKTAKLLTIGGVVFLISFALSTVSMFVAYPTASHRSTANQLTQLESKFWSGNDGQILESKEYKSLSSSAQARYSSVASTVGAVIEFILSIVLAFMLYKYLRRVRLNKHFTATTTIILTVTTTLTAVAMSYLQNLYFSSTLPAAWQILATIGFGLTFGLLVSYTITRIAEWSYNRRHSFIVE